MPKSLGQIHTVDFNYETPQSGTGTGNAFLCDVSGALSKQFNRNIRMMSIYKLCGADLVVQLPEAALIQADKAIVKGRMRYFQPTHGRCQALRDAYQQMRTMAKSQGVNISDNKLFDFRVLPRPFTEYAPNITYGPLVNLTTLDNSNELCMTGGTTGVSVFDSYNENVNPVDPNITAADFGSGLDTWQSGIQTDFVLEEGLIQSGNFRVADTVMEEIPFELAYDSTARRVHTLNWRPDPALYLGILGGWVEIVLDEITADGASLPAVDGVEIDVSLHIAGWKSIVSPRPFFKGKRSRSAKRMRNAGSMLTQKNVKDLLGILSMAKKLK